MKILVSLCLIISLGNRSAAQTTRALSAKEIARLLPSKLPAFPARADSKSSKQRVGNLTYSFCQSEYHRGDKFLKILLFDYAEASIMFEQSLANWRKMENVQSDSAIFKRWDSTDISGWVINREIGNTSQITLAIKNRFFLILEAKNVSAEELKLIYESLNPSQFPAK